MSLKAFGLGKYILINVQFCLIKCDHVDAFPIYVELLHLPGRR